MLSRWCVACLALAGPLAAGEFRAPLLTAPPRLDGRIEDDEWSAALRFDGLMWEGQLDRRRAQAWVAATTDYLYVALRSQLPEGGGLLTEVDRDTVKVVYDDSFEVWIDPTPGSEAGATYQMLANAAGHRAFQMHPRGGVPANPAWRADWEVAQTQREGWWEVEVAVPLVEIAPGRAATDGAFGINVCRNWKRPWAFSSLGGGAYAPSDRFVFTPTAPAIAFEERGDPFLGRIDGHLTVRNSTAAPIQVTALVEVERDVMPVLRSEEVLALAPGAAGEVKVAAEDASTQRFARTVRVTTADGGILYERVARWKRGEPWVWTVVEQPPLPVDFQFAYYPYLNRMRVAVDVRNLPADAHLQHISIEVRERESRRTIAREVFDSFVGGRQERTFDLPPLSGAYEIAASAAGEKVPAGELVKPFERTVFEWERRGLGTSRTVYPPFTPLQLAGNRLSSVLREHTLGPTGLWDQVVAAGAALLARPMAYRLSIDGRPVELLADGWAATEVSPDRVEYRGRFAAKGSDLAPFEYLCRFDVDGTMRAELTVPATGGHSLDALTLVIPLDGRQATHLHAMGDGIRNTIYERLAEGVGTIWTSRAVAVNDLPPGFCSYLFVGNPNRGLAWFADNDRGWSWDRQTPNIELVRAQDGEVQALVHLVNQPTVRAEPATIVFGLLAAPVKPRLGDWRYRWNRDQYTLLGTDINWFALGDCGSVYPAHADLWLWEMLARGNREELDDATVQQVIDRGRPYFEPYGPERLESWERHVRYNLRARRGKKMVFYYNRASFQLAPEFQTFQDEWALTDYRTVGPGNGIGEIKIVPSESYIDHALWWHGKSFDIGGNLGVYWDNWFLVGDYNTAMTRAYRGPDGAIVPSTGLWELRELSRRTFQYLNERGMFPITMPHMTSTNILPMHSYATVQYDWEWKYSEGDFQGRFPREYILLVTTGQLAGTWPVLLWDHGKLATDPWTQRTFAAVCIVHELNGGGLPQVWNPLMQPIYAILDQPGVEVYRYWDERPQPVRADHPDLPTIVYAVPGREALFAVCSYADQDVTCTLRVDAAAMGFTDGCRITDVETGEAIELRDGRVSFPLKKHDMRLARIEPAG